jgi:hypothetical protein
MFIVLLEVFKAIAWYLLASHTKVGFCHLLWNSLSLCLLQLILKLSNPGGLLSILKPQIFNQSAWLLITFK